MAEIPGDDWIIERLGSNHDRSLFNCGNPVLSDCLDLMAMQQHPRTCRILLRLDPEDLATIRVQQSPVAITFCGSERLPQVFIRDLSCPNSCFLGVGARSRCVFHLLAWIPMQKKKTNI